MKLRSDNLHWSRWSDRMFDLMNDGFVVAAVIRLEAPYRWLGETYTGSWSSQEFKSFEEAKAWCLAVVQLEGAS